MQIEKETRIIDLTVEQLVLLIAGSVASSSQSESHDDVPLNVKQACHFLGDMPKPTLYFKCSKGGLAPLIIKWWKDPILTLSGTRRTNHKSVSIGY